MGVNVYPEVILPPGMLMPYAGAAAPDGWLLCDGASLLRADYPALFAIIGTTYGSADATHFTLPNLTGKVIAGVDAAQTEFAALGQAGGSKTSTAAHTHSLSAHSHTLGTHTHSHGHTHGTDAPGLDHAHYVYGNNFNTGTMSANWSHYHTAEFVRVVYQTANATHAHAGGGNTASEGVSGGVYYGAHLTIDVASTDVNHSHNANHDHGTNLASQAGYGTTHSHATTSQSSSTSSGPTGASDGPSIDATGASSAAATSGNLQPYLALNYLIKT